MFPIFWLFLILTCGSCYSGLFGNNEEFLVEAERSELANFLREVEIGRDMVGRLFQYYGAYSDDELLRYVNAVGNYVSQFTDTNDRRYIFGILDSESINAFACPGSYVLITHSAIANMENEAELAMFLSHEIAHIEKRHLFATLLQLEKKDFDTLSEVEPLLAARKRHPDIYTNEVGENLVKYITGAAGPGVGMVNASKMGLRTLFERGFKEEWELEAEKTGMQIAIRAHYDPYAMRNFLKRLEKKRNSVDISHYEITHRKIRDRLSDLDGELEKVYASEIIAARGKARFLANTNNLRL